MTGRPQPSATPARQAPAGRPRRQPATQTHGTCTNRRSGGAAATAPRAADETDARQRRSAAICGGSVSRPAGRRKIAKGLRTHLSADLTCRLSAGRKPRAEPAAKPPERPRQPRVRRGLPHPLAARTPPVRPPEQKCTPAPYQQAKCHRLSSDKQREPRRSSERRGSKPHAGRSRRSKREAPEAPHRINRLRRPSSNRRNPQRSS